LTEGRLGVIADHENFFVLGRGKRLVVRKEFLPCAVSAGTFGSTYSLISPPAEVR